MAPRKEGHAGKAMADEFDVMIRELNQISQTDRAMRKALNTVLAEQKRRIFSQGQDANGSDIGTYSTRPISISRKDQAKNTGKTHFEGGYAEYKSLIGRNPGKVILRNTDQMMMDYGVLVLGNDQYGLGFVNDENGDKSDWLEDKYKKEIFSESDFEGQIVENVLYQELDRIIK